MKHPFKNFYLFLLVIFFAALVGGGYSYKLGFFNSLFQRIQIEQEEKHISFLLEIYDKIMENYWDKVDEEKLAQLYKLAAEKVTARPFTLNIKRGVDASPIKIALEKLLEEALKDLDDKKKKEVTINIAAAVLANLQPFGRSGLFTTKQEEQLKNTIQNINPEKDLYKDIGVEKGASQEDVAEAVEKRSEELKKQDTPEAKKELEKIAYAQDVLTDEDRKKRYDSFGVEPTIFHKFYTPDIVYLRFLKYSPTTYDEFVNVINSFDNPGGPRALIFDLRSNIGGAIDFVPYLMGHFIGKNQTAFELFQKGEYKPFKTVTEKSPGLTRIKQAVILIDNQTQSSAELMTSVLKKYRYAVVIGENSKGWGTVERIFPLDHQIDKSERYSMFLVHHITIRDDGEPIEGRGVEPNINIKGGDLEKGLYDYFRNPEFTNAVKKALKEPVSVN